MVIFQAYFYYGFCNLYSYLFCCMTRSEKFAFFTRVVLVTSSIHADTAHRRITFHVCIVTEKYVLFLPPSPVPNILPGICGLLFLWETSGADDIQQDRVSFCSVGYKLARKQTNSCIDFLARSAFSIQLQRERANWFIRHVLHNRQGHSPWNYTGGLSCSKTGS